MTAAAPIIVTALLGDEDLAWADGLRRAHFPPERNVLRAHLTLFHHLPPSGLDELRRLLMREVRTTIAPAARITRLLSLGRGVAFGVDSPGLAVIRSRIAETFDSMLTPQDRAGWRPHITVQNKVTPAEARELMAELSKDFEPRPLRIDGLSAYWYRGGPWESIGDWRFTRSGRSPRS